MTVAPGETKSKTVIGKAEPAKLGLFSKGPYYAVTNTNDKSSSVLGQ